MFLNNPRMLDSSPILLNKPTFKMIASENVKYIALSHH